MSYEPKDWKINDVIREEDLDHIELGLQECFEMVENHQLEILEINNILNLNGDSILKNYIDEINLQTSNQIPAIDITLTLEGEAAESKIVGENFNNIYSSIDSVKNFIGYEESSENNLNNRLQIIEQNEALQNITEAQQIRDDAALSAASAQASAEAAEKSAEEAASMASSAANSSIAGIEKYLYWKAGDRLEKTISEQEDVGYFWICPGYISNSATGIYFTINLGKPILAKKVEISNLRIIARSYNGYVGWGSTGSPDPLTPALQTIVCPETGTISVRLDNSSKWKISGSSSATTNNRPCSVTIKTIAIDFFDE